MHTQKQNPAGSQHRESCWGLFLVLMGLLFILAFFMELRRIVYDYRRYEIARAEIVKSEPRIATTKNGILYEITRCDILYNGHRQDQIIYPGSIKKQHHLWVLYDRRDPKHATCSLHRPSMFDVLNARHTTYFWLLAGWLSPSFIAVGLSVLYEALFLKR